MRSSDGTTRLSKLVLFKSYNSNRRVRKRVGGVLYWGSVQNARKKIFAIQDNEVLDQSLYRNVYYNGFGIWLDIRFEFRLLSLLE